jgi:hypothetical protein
MIFPLSRPAHFVAALALCAGQVLPPAIELTPPRLLFLGDERDDSLPAQRVMVRTARTLPTTWTATASHAWIVVSPDRGDTPATLLVGVNRTGLTSGTHTGSVTVRATNSSDQRVLQVSLRIAAPRAPAPSVTSGSGGAGGSPGSSAGARLRVLPDHVTFASPAGQADPLSFSLKVEADQAAGWTARVDRSWVTVSPTRGTAPSDLTLKVSPERLQVGEHNALLTITAETTQPAIRVPIVFTLQPADGPLAFTATSLPTAALNVPYSQALPYAGGTPPYVSSVVAGYLPADLALVNNVISGVPRSTGVFTFSVAVRDGSAPPQIVSETLTIPVAVLDQHTALEVQPAVVKLLCTAARPPAAVKVAIGSGGPPFNWRASGEAAWLRVEPTSGMAPAEISVGAEPGDLAPGTYTSAVTVTMDNVLNSPVRLQVELVVKP